MKRLFVFGLAVLLVLGICYVPASAGDRYIKVMTRNQFLGADLTPLILAQTPEEFTAAAAAALAQVGANNFPLRAQRLAAEIAFTGSDLIGLQEVYDFKLNGMNMGPPFVDHLEVTLDALQAKGLNYVVAATVVNLDITIPFDMDGEGNIVQLSVVDRDVILAREGVAFEKLDGDFTTGGLCGLEIPLPSLPFPLQSTPSADGCNYTIVGEINSPIGPIAIERGFVGVDATVRGKKYRFVNTHLEQRQPDPTNPESTILQSLQAVELAGTLQALTPPDLTLVLLGDFNSCDEDVSTDGIVPPYQIFVDAGYVDIWDKNPLRIFNPNGFTCCQPEDLANPTSLLYERVDLIFVRGPSVKSLAFVTGQVPIFPLALPPNWASDHGGVFGKLTFIEPRWRPKSWKGAKRY